MPTTPLPSDANTTLPDPAPNSRTATGGATDATAGQVDAMVRHGGEASEINREARKSPVNGESQGARGGSPLGSQAPSTGMGDGPPTGGSQGLTGAQGSGGGADPADRR